MDQAVKRAQRKAQLNPEDSASLWAYIRQLERAAEGGDVEPAPLFAFLTDGLIGEPSTMSGFSTAVPYHPGDDKITLFGRWMDDETADDPALYFAAVTQAWIVTEETLQAITALWKDATYDRDSEADAISSAVSSLYKNMALKTVTFPDYGGVEDYEFMDNDLESRVFNAYMAYRTSKDGGKVRVALDYHYDVMDALLGEWSPESSDPGHPPRRLLVCDIENKKPFEAVLYRQASRHHLSGFVYALLCKHCDKKSLRCSLFGQGFHVLDHHVILEIDGQPIADREAFDIWLKENK